MPMLHCSITAAFYQVLKSSSVSSSARSFFRTALTILVPLYMHTNFRVSLLISIEQKTCWDFGWDCVDSLGHLGRTVILTILILVEEQGIALIQLDLLDS